MHAAAYRPDTEWLALDLSRLAGPSRALRAWLSDAPHSIAVRDSLRLVPRASLSPALLDELERADVFQPVLRDGDARLVALPEVRAELKRSTTARRLRARVTYGSFQSSCEELRGAPELTLIFRPRSGRGADALALAEELRLRPGVGTAGARLVRVTPPPGRAPAAAD